MTLIADPEVVGVDSPDAQVAHSIVERLLADGLIDPSQKAAVWLGLAEGTARGGDWRLLAENALAMEERHAAGTH